jgi:flagellar protein FlaG
MIEGILKLQNFENIPVQKTVRPKQVTKDKNKDEETVKKDNTQKDQNNDIQGAVERIVNAAKFFNRKIQVEIVNDLGITVVKVIDGDTKEVIRQIPPEELVELSRRAKDLKGLLVSKEG